MYILSNGSGSNLQKNPVGNTLQTFHAAFLLKKSVQIYKNQTTDIALHNMELNKDLFWTAQESM